MANMAAVVDGMVKEYLLFRGFTATLKNFDNEIKTDKDKSFRVDKIVDQIQAYITGYDLLGLRSFWAHLDRRLFSKFGHDAYKNVKKLETSILRLYLVHAIQNTKQDRVIEFFEKCTPDLQNLPAWKEWFAIPFLKNPEQNPMFSIYFTRVWQESLMMALYNCIDTVLSHMTLPTLLNFEREKERLDRLEEDNRKFREQIATFQQEIIKMRSMQRLGKKEATTQTDMDTLEDDSEYLMVNTKPGFLQTMMSTTPLRSTKPKIGWKIGKGGKANKKQEDQPQKKKKGQSEQRDTLQDEKGGKSNSNKQESPRKETKPKSSFDIKNKLPLGKSSPLLMHRKTDDSSSESDRDLVLSMPVTENSVFYMSITEDDKNKASSYKDTISSRTPPSVGVHDNLVGESLSDHFSDDFTKPFILLSQEEYSEHMSAVVNTRFSPDGTAVGSLDTDGVIKIWQCHPTLSTLASVSLKPQALSFEWVPKLENKILIGKLNGRVVMYDAASRKSVFEGLIESKYQRIVSLACSPNGSSCAVSASSGTLPFKRSATFSERSPKTKKRLMKLQSVTDSIKHNTEGTIFSWDLKAFKEQVELALEPYPVCIHCMSYNHNGTLLVTGGADGMIRLFDMRTCDCLVGWHAHSSDVLDVQFSVDETSLYSLGGDGKLCLWDVHKVSFKTAEFTLHDGATGYHCDTDDFVSSPSTMVDYKPTGRLFSFDSDGKYMLTCAQNGTLMYKTSQRTTLDQVMRVGSHKSSVCTLDWSSSPNCSTCVAGSLLRKGAIAEELALEVNPDCVNIATD